VGKTKGSSKQKEEEAVLHPSSPPSPPTVAFLSWRRTAPPFAGTFASDWCPQGMPTPSLHSCCSKPITQTLTQATTYTWIYGPTTSICMYYTEISDVLHMCTPMLSYTESALNTLIFCLKNFPTCLHPLGSLWMNKLCICY
jgi:hypothetical protein